MRLISLVAAAALASAPMAAEAALAVGAKAPDFQTEGALGGKPFHLKLSQQLKRGPVVLYFFPAAFTPGCTAEAHEFAEATDQFRKLGASVVGLSADPVDKLSDFSVKECRNKFPVATATPAVISAYDVKMPTMSNLPPNVQEMMAGKTMRTSYVIAPNGRIIYAHSDLDYRDHVKNTLASVKEWKAKRGG